GVRHPQRGERVRGRPGHGPRHRGQTPGSRAADPGDVVREWVPRCWMLPRLPRGRPPVPGHLGESRESGPQYTKRIRKCVLEIRGQAKRPSGLSLPQLGVSPGVRSLTRKSRKSPQGLPFRRADPPPTRQLIARKSRKFREKYLKIVNFSSCKINLAVVIFSL